MSTHAYLVRGMTCAHCARSVTAALEELDAVTDVTVDVVPDGESTVSVTSSAELADSDVRDAVREAGYELVGPARG